MLVVRRAFPRDFRTMADAPAHDHSPAAGQVRPLAAWWARASNDGTALAVLGASGCMAG